VKLKRRGRSCESVPDSVLAGIPVALWLCLGTKGKGQLDTGTKGKGQLERICGPGGVRVNCRLPVLVKQSEGPLGPGVLKPLRIPKALGSVSP
jgi:hypothetical protein